VRTIIPASFGRKKAQKTVLRGAQVRALASAREIPVPPLNFCAFLWPSVWAENRVSGRGFGVVRLASGALVVSFRR
jgi:hypothetical protein